MQIPELIYEIASIIDKDWKNMYFGAVPYVNAMYSLKTIDDQYGDDSARSIIVYFLANAQTWRGEMAKAVKAKLKQMCKH